MRFAEDDRNSNLILLLQDKCLAHVTKLGPLNEVQKASVLHLSITILSIASEVEAHTLQLVSAS